MSKKLLLADDSVTIQKVVGITFANEDVELLTETSGAAALERIRTGAPDIVLADVSMPEMTGYELCAAIKADPSIAHVPVILLTGTFEPYDEDRTRQSGADGHIAKPFEAQALVDLVHTTLNRKAAAPQAEPVALPPEPVALPPEPVAPLAEPAVAPLPDLAPVVTPALPDFSDQSTVLQPVPNIEPPAPGVSAGSAVSGEAVRTLDPQPDLLTPTSTGDRAGSGPSPEMDVSGGETVFHQAPPAVAPHAPAPEIDPSGQETILDSVVPSAPSVPELPSVDPFGLETVVANPPAPIADPVDPAGPVDPMDISGPSTEQPTQFLDPNAAGPLTPPSSSPSSGSGPDSEPSLSTDSDIFGAPLVDQDPEPEPSVLAAEEALEAIEAMPTDSAQGLPSPEAFDFNEPAAAASAAAVAAQAIIDADTNVPELELAPIEETPIEDAPIDAAPLEDEFDETDPSPFDSNPLADTQPETETETNGASDASFAASQDAGQSDLVAAAASDLINPDEVRAALEKVAWDAFGSLSEQIVRDVVTKLEAVAWEVVPTLAERLIKEEIQRLKNGNSSS